MPLKLSVEVRNIQLDTLAALASGGFIDYYDGEQPESPDSTPTGTRLCRLLLGFPAFGPASNGVLTANQIGDDTDAYATGVASWFRVSRSDESPLFDGEIGPSGITINTTAILIHAKVTLDELTYSL